MGAFLDLVRVIARVARAGSAPPYSVRMMESSLRPASSSVSRQRGPRGRIFSSRVLLEPLPVHCQWRLANIVSVSSQADMERADLALERTELAADETPKSASWRRSTFGAVSNRAWRRRWRSS